MGFKLSTVVFIYFLATSHAFAVSAAKEEAKTGGKDGAKFEESEEGGGSAFGGFGAGFGGGFGGQSGVPGSYNPSTNEITVTPPQSNVPQNEILVTARPPQVMPLSFDGNFRQETNWNPPSGGGLTPEDLEKEIHESDEETIKEIATTLSPEQQQELAKQTLKANAIVQRIGENTDEKTVDKSAEAYNSAMRSVFERLFEIGVQNGVVSREDIAPPDDPNPIGSYADYYFGF